MFSDFCIVDTARQPIRYNDSNNIELPELGSEKLMIGQYFKLKQTNKQTKNVVVLGSRSWLFWIWCHVNKCVSCNPRRKFMNWYFFNHQNIVCKQSIIKYLNVGVWKFALCVTWFKVWLKQHIELFKRNKINREGKHCCHHHVQGSLIP